MGHFLPIYVRSVQALLMEFLLAGMLSLLLSGRLVANLNVFLPLDELIQTDLLYFLKVLAISLPSCVIFPY